MAVRRNEKWHNRGIPAAKPTKQIDYILFRPERRFRVAAARVIDEAVACDHRPVLAVVEWQKD